MHCNHQRRNERWVDEFENDWGHTEPGHWEYETVSSTIDLDTHRYQCTQCGKIMYYSGAAKEYYETGVDRKGLFT